MKLKVQISWCKKNYCCAWSEPSFGAVIATNKTIAGLKKEFEQSLKEQIESIIADGDELPEWLAKGDYEIEYELEISAILRNAEQFTTMSAISKASGINQRQLTHYALSLKRPRPEQREKIIAGLHHIGETFLAIQ